MSDARAEDAQRMPARSSAAAAVPASPALIRPQPMGLVINRQPAPNPALVVVSGDAVFIRRSDLAPTGLLLADEPSAFQIAGHDYVALSQLSGLRVALEGDGSVLAITADPAMFPASRHARADQAPQVGDIVPAAFISYDLTFARWNGQGTAFAFLDAGVSGGWGLVGTTATLQSGGAGAVRLDSYFQRDWPGDRVRLVAGDTITRATEWSAPVRFAGVRIGTDFSLAPTLVTSPLPVLTAAATLPSTVALISAASQQTIAVQPGTFSIDYQPVFSGAGEVTMMITDANGLSRQITRSFYTSPRLLRPGLVDFSIEAGVLRENYGIASFDYGAPFAAGFVRTGLSDTLSLGVRAEAGRDVRMLGAGAGWVVPAIGEFALAAAVSDSALGTGTLWRAQFQRTAATHALTASYQRTSGTFAQAGGLADGARIAGAPRSELALAGSLSLGRVGDIVLGHAQTRNTDGEHFQTTSLALNGDISTAFYTVGLRRNRFAGRTNDAAFVSLSMPLGQRSNAGFRIDDQRALATFQIAPPDGAGAGYQMALGYDAASGAPIIDAAALLRTDIGEVELAGGRNGAAHGVRLGLRGSVVAVGGQVMATPRLDDAFALVDLGSEEAVTLFLENRPVAVRAGAGRAALVTGLQPYTHNRIAVDVAALPITAEIATGETLVVPGFRQAVRAKLGGAPQSPVTVPLIGSDDRPLKPGMAVHSGAQQLGVTGYDGLVFAADLAGGETLVVSGPAFRCEARIPAALSITPDRRIAPVRCLPAAIAEPVP